MKFFFSTLPTKPKVLILCNGRYHGLQVALPHLGISGCNPVRLITNGDSVSLPARTEHKQCWRHRAFILTSQNSHVSRPGPCGKGLRVSRKRSIALCHISHTDWTGRMKMRIGVDIQNILHRAVSSQHRFGGITSITDIRFNVTAQLLAHLVWI